MKQFYFWTKCSKTGNFFKFPFGIVLFGATLLLYRETDAYMVGSNPYRRVEKLDEKGNVMLEFEVDRSASRITFNLTVETTGYVGFGLRARGRESEADIVIGGVYPDGESYFSDQHSTGPTSLEVDASQDYELHEAKENDTHTFLSFSRDLDTCDPQDYTIVEDKVTLVWAYGERDELVFHYSNRGDYPIHLLNPDYTPPIDRDLQTNAPLVIHSPYNEDVQVWSWHFAEVMPRDQTTYWCHLRQGPVLPKKHHYIGVEVRFNNPETRTHLHHVLISKCKAPPGFSEDSLFGPNVNQGQLCYGAGGRTSSVQQQHAGPIRTEYCMDYLYVSVIGDRINFLPPQMGTPFGEEPREYYLIQLHYDNPLELTGVKMDVNVDIFHTPNLRPNEGDMLVVRHESPGIPLSQLIPPHSIDQKTYGICGSECSKKMFPKEGIRVVAVLLHSHNSGVGIRLRHFRNGDELTPVVVENNYSNTYQQTRALPREVRILPGDQLVVECTQDNTWTNGTVVGGFTTRQEMCVAWLYYYNRIPNHSICASEVDSPEFRQSFLGIQNVTWSTPHLEYLVTSPRNLAGLPVTKVSDMLDWTMDKREEFNQFLLTYPHSNRCPIEIYGRPHGKNENGDPVDLQPQENIPVLVSLPKQMESYTAPETCSQRAGANIRPAVSTGRKGSSRLGSNNNTKNTSRRNTGSSGQKTGTSSKGWGNARRWK